MSEFIMTAEQFAKNAARAAKEFSTLYVMGGIGSPINDSTAERLINSYSYNSKPERRQMILSAKNTNCFAFDCICFIKGLLWGWRGDAEHEYGGAVYRANGVDDLTIDRMLSLCSDVSCDFSEISVGEYLFMEGHCGIYVGGGLAVECTPKWKNGVQITAVENVETSADHPMRKWEKHGKLPYLDYSQIDDGITDDQSSQNCSCQSCESISLLKKLLSVLLILIKKLRQLFSNQ